jgi:hypothetical protein
MAWLHINYQRFTSKTGSDIAPHQGTQYATSSFSFYLAEADTFLFCVLLINQELLLGSAP